MKLISSGAVAVAVFVFSIFAGGAPALAIATAPDLGAAASFSILGAAAMSSANTTTVSGDLGLSPGLAASKTGTWVVGGSEYFGTGGLSQTAQASALGAFNNMVSQITEGTWLVTNTAPTPGVWAAAGSPVFPGPTLTLNGSASDVWVFKLSTDFTFTGSVVLAGNAQACNVFWQVAGDATLASGAAFAGTLIAQNDITVASGATINGRLISLSGTTIAMNGANSFITGPTCATATPTPILQGGDNIGTITVIKMVINDNGGTKGVADFPLFVDGVLVGSGITNNSPINNKIYTVTETLSAGYTRTFSGDCDSSGRFTSGGTKVCVVTNNDIGAPLPVPPVPPVIDVVKVPSPLSLPGGPGPVTYTYTLRNMGTVPVTDVTLTGDTCSPIVRTSGDVNGDNKLDVTETWTHTCSTTLSATHTNTVVATGWANGISAIDAASATVVVGAPVIPPLIHVVKVPSPFVLPAGGGAAMYTYTVTNPGTAPLSNVTITDDKCTGLPGRVVGHPGDINQNNLLESNEVWTFTCQTTLRSTTLNIATATGEANGLTAKDIATATVVVSVPGLPATGFPPEGRSGLANFLIAVAVVMFGISARIFVLRKRTI